jgi:hypothetical protein
MLPNELLFTALVGLGEIVGNRRARTQTRGCLAVDSDASIMDFKAMQVHMSLAAYFNNPVSPSKQR